MSSLSISSLVQRVSQQYNVLGVFDLLHYGQNFDQLYHDLLAIKKNQFDHHDRIVFLFYDTEYYFENQFGITTMNIYKIVDYLNIPTFFCLIITQQDYVKKNIQQLQQTYFSYDRPIPVINIHIDPPGLFDVVPKITNNFGTIKKSFTFLSGRNRKHRIAFYSLLEHYQLLNLGQVSVKVDDSIYKTLSVPLKSANNLCSLPTNLEIVVPIPYTISNENWVFDGDVKSIYDTFIKNSPVNFNFKNFDETLLTIWDIANPNIELMQQSFLYVSAETVFNYPGSYLSEKSFKGIMCRRPFVMLGPPNNLKRLKEYGFKTFDCWWDESYDNIVNPSDRLTAVFNIVKFVSQLTNKELINLAYDMSSVLEYNYNHFTNDFKNLQLDSFKRQCSE